MFKKQNRDKHNSKSSPHRRWGLRVMVLFLVVVLSAGPIMTRHTGTAQAYCIPCAVCYSPDPWAAMFLMNLVEDELFSPMIKGNIHDHMNEEIKWIVRDFFKKFWVRGLAELTEYLGAFGMKQIEMLGMFMDAEAQIETTRLMMTLQAQAHKDYHPSEGICWIGTNARSLAASDQKIEHNMRALAEQNVQRSLNFEQSSGGQGAERDIDNKWRNFILSYCDPRDNGWIQPGTGLDLACDHDGQGGASTTGASDASRMNIDIDYTKLVEEPRTIKTDFTNGNNAENGDQDVIALSQNLYGNHTPLIITRNAMDDIAGQKLYMLLRGLAARRGVAQSSYNAIIAMKAGGSNGANVQTFMGAAIRELLPSGTADADIYSMIGENPSYYAQLELLSKKIYQNPDFFADLYDKPANVARKSVAMKAIDLMLDRALYESELRQEMLLSVLLATEMHSEFRKTNVLLSRKD